MAIQTEGVEQPLEITPKSVEIPIPSGPALYYMQAAIKGGIEQLMQNRKFMELASDTTTVAAMTDAMVCLIGLSESMDEIAVENMKEVQSQRMAMMQTQQSSELEATFAHSDESIEGR